MDLKNIQDVELLEELKRRTEDPEEDLSYCKLSNWLEYSRKEYRCKVLGIEFISPVPDFSHF